MLCRGVGTVLLSVIRQLCADRGKGLLAQFKHTDRNRLIHIMYKFNGFAQVSGSGDGLVHLENDLRVIPPAPKHIDLVVEPQTSSLALKTHDP